MDKYIEYIIQKYDLQEESMKPFVAPQINISEIQSFDWNIGLICGSSGSGKSTILREQFAKSDSTPKYDLTKPIISQFSHMTPEEVCSLFESMGLSSIPVWLHLPNQLSVGEKARFDMCWLIANNQSNEYILIDEFTSTVNRECALSMAHSLQRYIRNKGLKIILASCHFDIIDYLCPDWILNLDKQSNNQVEVEVMQYADKPYDKYKRLNSKDILSEEKKI